MLKTLESMILKRQKAILKHLCSKGTGIKVIFLPENPQQIGEWSAKCGIMV